MHCDDHAGDAHLLAATKCCALHCTSAPTRKGWGVGTVHACWSAMHCEMLKLMVLAIRPQLGYKINDGHLTHLV